MGGCRIRWVQVVSLFLHRRSGHLAVMSACLMAFSSRARLAPARRPRRRQQGPPGSAGPGQDLCQGHGVAGQGGGLRPPGTRRGQDPAPLGQRGWVAEGGHREAHRTVQRANQEMELLRITLDLHPAALTRALRPGEDYPHRASQVPRRIGVESRFWALVVAEKLVLTKDDLPM